MFLSQKLMVVTPVEGKQEKKDTFWIWHDAKRKQRQIFGSISIRFISNIHLNIFYAFGDGIIHDTQKNVIIISEHLRFY